MRDRGRYLLSTHCRGNSALHCWLRKVQHLSVFLKKQIAQKTTMELFDNSQFLEHQEVGAALPSTSFLTIEGSPIQRPAVISVV